MTTYMFSSYRTSSSEINAQEMIDDNEVVIFGKGEKGEPGDEMSVRLQDIFEEISPDYEMVNVQMEPELKEEIRDISGCSTFPQVFIHGEFAGDFDTIVEMYDEGELAEMLLS